MNYSDILKYSLAFEKIAGSIFSYASHFGVELGKDKYYHWSKKPITTVRDFVSQVGKTFDISDRSAELQKPKGLWYGIGTSWSEFIGEDDYYDEDFSNKYLYELTIDKSKILVIDSDDKLKDFNKRFKTEQVITDNGILVTVTTGINWDLVSKHYCGIEVVVTKLSQNVKGYGSGFKFLESWDVDSGCIWNTSCISLRLKSIRGTDGKWVKQEDNQKNKESDEFLIEIWKPRQQVGFFIEKTDTIPSKEELLDIVQKYDKENPTKLTDGIFMLEVTRIKNDIPIKGENLYRLTVETNNLGKTITLKRTF